MNRAYRRKFGITSGFPALVGQLAALTCSRLVVGCVVHNRTRAYWPGQQDRLGHSLGQVSGFSAAGQYPASFFASQHDSSLLSGQTCTQPKCKMSEFLPNWPICTGLWRSSLPSSGPLTTIFSSKLMAKKRCNSLSYNVRDAGWLTSTIGQPNRPGALSVVSETPSGPAVRCHP